MWDTSKTCRLCFRSTEIHFLKLTKHLFSLIIRHKMIVSAMQNLCCDRIFTFPHVASSSDKGYCTYHISSQTSEFTSEIPSKRMPNYKYLITFDAIVIRYFCQKCIKIVDILTLMPGKRTSS